MVQSASSEGDVFARDLSDRWETTTLRVLVTNPKASKSVTVYAKAVPEQFFRCIGQFGRDVADALQIEGRSVRAFDEDEGEFFDFIEADATVSMSDFTLHGRIMIVPSNNGTFLFDDFLAKIPVDLNMRDVVVSNVGIPTREDGVSDKILRFYQECLRETPPIASIDLIRDSQTTRLLAEIFRDRTKPSIVDYGCGALRLLHALLTKCGERQWSYLGLDVTDPAVGAQDSCERLRLLPTENQWTTQSISEARISGQQFDVGVMMNVLHELPIEDIARSLQDMRRLLSPQGTLILIDTVLLPEGEPRFVPFYPWEIQEMTANAEDRSYISKSGIPISFYRIPSVELPSYYGLADRIAQMMHLKRDHWSQLAVNLSKEENVSGRQALGLGKSKEFDYAYLNAIVANASFRISEFANRRKSSPENFDECACQIVRSVQDSFNRRGRCPSAEELFDQTGLSHDYGVIERTLALLQGPSPGKGVIFPIYDPHKPLVPSEAWDILEDAVDEIPKRGIERCVWEAVARVASD